MFIAFFLSIFCQLLSPRFLARIGRACPGHESSDQPAQKSTISNLVSLHQTFVFSARAGLGRNRLNTVNSLKIQLISINLQTKIAPYFWVTRYRGAGGSNGQSKGFFEVLSFLSRILSLFLIMQISELHKMSLDRKGARWRALWTWVENKLFSRLARQKMATFRRLFEQDQIKFIAIFNL